MFGGRGVEDALLLPEERHDPVVLLEVGVLHQDVVAGEDVPGTALAT